MVWLLWKPHKRIFGYMTRLRRMAESECQTAVKSEKNIYVTLEGTGARFLIPCVLVYLKFLLIWLFHIAESHNLWLLGSIPAIFIYHFKPVETTTVSQILMFTLIILLRRGAAFTISIRTASESWLPPERMTPLRRLRDTLGWMQSGVSSWLSPSSYPSGSAMLIRNRVRGGQERVN